MLLSACGGGGGGGTPPAASSSSIGAQLTANAGPDRTVNAGDRVELDPGVTLVGANGFSLGNGALEVTGTSTVSTDVVKIQWTKMEGASVALSTNDTTSGKAFFIAPDVGIEANVKIVYQLKITNAAGKTAEDTLTITVNRLNKKPVVDAGADISSNADLPLTLTGVASDEDGQVVKYQWKQISGPTVTINNASSAEANFVAPTTDVSVALIFELTVEDNDGAVAKDQITVSVAAGGAPRLAIHFPSAFGIYGKNTISAFGSASAVDGTLASVTVDAGTGPLNAVVDAVGNWRLENITVSAGDTFTVTVEALDSFGRKTSQSRTLNQTGFSVGSGDDWDETVGIGIDSALNKLYVLTSGFLLEDVTLLSVDLSNGNRSQPISSFDKTSQGLNDSALTTMAYDPIGKMVYAATAPAVGTPKIISIHPVNGTRRLVSDNTRGSGATIQYPTSLALGRNSDSLYVADVNASRLVEVTVANGNRSTVADASLQTVPVDAPATIAYLPGNSQSSGRLYWAPNLVGDNVVVDTLLSVTPSSSLLSNSFDFFQGTGIKNMLKGMVVDSARNSIYLVDGNDDLFTVDLTTGYRTRLAIFTGSTRIAFDDTKGLLYLVEDLNGGPVVYVVDPVTGNKIQLSNK
ncbi:PKD domain-containing protein [Cellvibrio sp. UBA7671]|uniref:PKD domain-containing protein n=1 Tax=Cellvibrio sp. UBA7671 TaxID=1946312 RepID=UPI002F35377F